MSAVFSTPGMRTLNESDSSGTSETDLEGVVNDSYGQAGLGKSLAWSLGNGDTDLASVIVTAFNQGWVLAETLQSIAAQTYRPIECVIVNDGSTDKTPNVIADFVSKYSTDLQFVVVDQANQGAQIARNNGVLASSGEFIQLLDGDDLLSPDKLEAHIRFLSSPDGAKSDVVYGDARWLHEFAGDVEVGEKIGVGDVQDILDELLQLARFNPPFTYLCRRSAVERCGRWDSQYVINDDVEYFLRMACSTLGSGSNFAYVAGETGYYRTHSHSRISEGGTLLRSRYTWLLLRAIEAVMKAEGLLTKRRKSLAKAYRVVSRWSFPVDREIWQKSLDDCLRLWPSFVPESPLSRALQATIGLRKTEIVMGMAADLKQRLLSPARKCSEWRRRRRIAQSNGLRHASCPLAK
jgi:glycosyltransferase involved in cell wall biosynthesis